MDIGHLLSNLFTHWVSLLSALTSIIIGMYEKFTKKRFKFIGYVVVSLVFLSIAIYQTVLDYKIEENRRRVNILYKLRNEYILSHDNISSKIMAGTELPPKDWTNKRLKELGEDWHCE